MISDPKGRYFRLLTGWVGGGFRVPGDDVRLYLDCMREPGHAEAGSRWYRTFQTREMLRWLRGEYNDARVIEQFRLLVLRTAWLIDKHHDYQKVRRDIAAVKVAMPQVLHDVVQRAMHLHGALGVSDEMPFVKMMLAAESLGIADGATELHKMTVARRTLREYQPVTTLFPSQHIPTRRAHAEAWLAQRLEHAIAEF